MWHWWKKRRNKKKNMITVSNNDLKPGRVNSMMSEAALNEKVAKEKNRKTAAKKIVDNNKVGEGLNSSREEVKKIKEEKKDKEVSQDEKKAAAAKEIAALTTSRLKLVPSNCQHIGARERQEDAFGFSDLADSEYVNENGVLAVVADGMGGLAKGDRASQIAVSVFLREYINRQAQDPLNKHLLWTLKRSNAAVYDLAFTGGEDDDLGTTLVAAAVENGEMHWVSAGDSHIYLYRDNNLKQLNKDHIYANKLEKDVENGVISRKEADRHPERAYLTSYLGCHELPEIDCSAEPVKLKPGDVVMLCSDGLTNTLPPEEIIAVFNDPPVNIAEELVKLVLFKEKRHQDNVTILVLKCMEVKE